MDYDQRKRELDEALTNDEITEEEYKEELEELEGEAGEHDSQEDD